MTLTEELSSEEKNAIEELRARMKDSLTPKLSEDSSLYYRFLKARDFNVDKAEKMLMKHITWRKVHQIDTILSDFKPREGLCKYAFPARIGFDKDGDLVVYGSSGKYDTSDILNCVKMNEYIKTLMWFCEQNEALLKQQSEKTGRQCERITYIVDLDELTLSNATSKSTTEKCMRLLHLFQDNYPERLKAFYLINAPAYYVFIFTILKTVMSKAMLQKIKVFGETGWKEKLLNIIDADVLPAFLGGNRTDPDGNPLCLTFVRHGGKVSPEYYLSNEERYFKNMNEVKTIIIPHQGRKDIYVDVTENGSLIQWEFLVKGKDSIGFGLSFQISQENIKEVIPIGKYSTADGTEEGFYKPLSIGKYIVIFDNSHNWLNSKEIQYCVSVIKPE